MEQSLFLTTQVAGRSASAALTSFILSLILGRLCIAYQRRREIGQSVRKEGPESHYRKQGTPTAGGLFFVASAVISSVLWVREPHILLSFLVAWVGFSLIGLYDDLLKIRQRSSDGLGGYSKIALQILVSYALLYLIRTGFAFELSVPVPLTRVTLELGSWYYPLAILYIVFFVNAANLSDGLDGLAGGLAQVLLLTFVAIGFFALTGITGSAAGSFIFDSRRELIVVISSVLGSISGFLWYNAGKAQVFMGDTGSMAIGGMLAYTGILTHNELLTLLIGIVFVCEALSVIIQVTSFKLTGRRVFLMAPIHHHFEKAGWSESTVVNRFWIIAVLASVTTLLLLC